MCNRAVLAEAILSDMLRAWGRNLDVTVASASVGPAPPGMSLKPVVCSIFLSVLLLCKRIVRAGRAIGHQKLMRRCGQKISWPHEKTQVIGSQLYGTSPGAITNCRNRARSSIAGFSGDMRTGLNQQSRLCARGS